MLRDRRRCFVLIRPPDEWLHNSVRFVELLLGLFLRNGVLERVDCVELAHSVLVERVNTLEGSLADRLLVVSQEEATELRSLEEVLAVVLRLRHTEDVDTV